jgi:hypothetical protein
MRRIFTIIALLVVIAMLAGCGAVYTRIQTPMKDINAPLHDTAGEKVGRASCKSYVWVVVVGDCSIRAAMTDGGIAKIHHVDTDIKTVLAGLYGRVTIVVYGD